jgi:hypothetical protein
LPLGGVRFGASLPEKRATLSVKAGVSTLRVNSKSQIPKTKLQRIEASTSTDASSPLAWFFWDWEFVWSLDFGIWIFSSFQLHTCKDDFVV